MGGIILEGLIECNLVQDIHVSEPNEQCILEISKKHPKVQCSTRIEALAKSSDLIILCVKPSIVRSSLEMISEYGKDGQVIVSIAAGVTLASLLSLAYPFKYIRVMPNTPCQVKQGMTIICPDSNVSTEHTEFVQALFNFLGRTLILPEDKMNAATALSGSGPGLVLLMIEALADGGVFMGIPKDQALLLVTQTMVGTAQMVIESKQHPGVLRDQVCTPGGCTIAGLASLEDQGVRGALIKAVEATAIAAARLG